MHKILLMLSLNGFYKDFKTSNWIVNNLTKVATKLGKKKFTCLYFIWVNSLKLKLNNLKY